MPYEPNSNVSINPTVPEDRIYLMGVDVAHSASITNVSVSATASNAWANLDDVKITMAEVLRAAESIPPRGRGASLQMPIYTPPTTYGYTYAASDPITIQTLTVPWNVVYQYQALAASSQGGYAQQQAQSGAGQWGNLMGGLAELGQSAGAQTAAGAQAMQFEYGAGLAGQLGNFQTAMNGMYYNYNTTIYCGPPETPEERATRIAQEEERAAKLVVAESRAEQLMFSLLRPDQVKQYLDHGYFETDVNDRVYRIKKGRSMNVELIVKGKPTIRYCAHPRDWTPAPDAMIAQLLMLKTDEQKFIATANRVQLAA